MSNSSNETSLMKKTKYIIIVPIILALILLGICAYVFGTDSVETITAAVLLGVYTVVVIIAYVKLRPVMNATIVDYALEQGKIQKELLANLAVPYAIFDTDGHVMWANKEFKSVVGVDEKKRIKKSIDSYFPELTPEVLDTADDSTFSVTLEDKIYDVELKRVDLSNVFADNRDEQVGDDIVIAMYLFDVTELKRFEKMAKDQQLFAGLIYIDNYDEVMDSTEDVKHAILTALVDRKINMYLQNIDAIVKHIENDKYFFVFRRKYLETLRSQKFSLLDEVKGIGVGNEIAMTLSIGIGSSNSDDQDGYIEAYDNARTAIGLALGRGGDQVALKLGDKVTYYGGKSAGTEKTTRVKARVKAQAFEELLVNKETVIIMAHKRPDADAFGSAMGVYRLVTALGKKAYVVLNEVTDAIRPIYNALKATNLYEEALIDNTKALSMVDPNTMIVVCDVNRPSLTECEELLSHASTVVVFDHHRQSNEAITNATLSYIEPFASSACEMITEMYQYTSKKPRLKSQEADAMYSGILIDTDNFLTKTGVRTFEAAAYLRKNGADVTRVRKMFRSSMIEMKERAMGIDHAEVFMDQFALSYVDPEESQSDAPTVAVAKVANELLNVVNINASFVVTEAEDGILYVSARSVGDVNVQLVMERFNGGGHANVAGVQLPGVTKEEFFKQLKDVLTEMYKEGEI